LARRVRCDDVEPWKRFRKEPVDVTKDRTISLTPQILGQQLIVLEMDHHSSEVEIQLFDDAACIVDACVEIQDADWAIRGTTVTNRERGNEAAELLASLRRRCCRWPPESILPLAETKLVPPQLKQTRLPGSERSSLLRL
jgi:hypothetical protein